MKLSKDKCIELILEQLEIGTPYKQTFEVILSNFKLSEPTFVTYWKLANERYKEAQQAIKSSTEIQTITNELDRLKTLNLTKIDRMRIAESIALNEDGTASNADKLKALDYLAKIESDYAPMKTENKVELAPPPASIEL